MSQTVHFAVPAPGGRYGLRLVGSVSGKLQHSVRAMGPTGGEVGLDLADTPDVRIDPLRQSGQPVVRSVPTAVLAEGFRAGTGVTELADLYDLRSEQVLQAIRYEMRSAQSRSAA